MARTFTIAQIKTRCKRRANMENSNFVSDAELFDLINEAYAELYDVLVAAYEHYFVSLTTVTLTAGTTTYNLPADFYKVLAVDFQTGGSWQPVLPLSLSERGDSQAAAIPAGSVRVRYIPAPTVFTTDVQTIDGISGWESLLITDVAIMMLEKEESDTTALERRRQREMARVSLMAQNRDVVSSGVVSDVTRPRSLWGADILRYRFYGSQIEFINMQYLGVG